VPKRPLLVRLGWTLRDYAKRVWDNSGEDNIFFLAGGIAFNILLAAIPFLLLMVAGLAYFLNQSTEASSAEVSAFLDQLLPPHLETGESPIHQMLGEIIQARGSATLFGAVGFVWLSTRLFGSLRSVLADVFDIETDRGIIAGKLFDIRITIISTLLFVAYSALSAYLELATRRGVRVLTEYGVRTEFMGGVGYTVGQLFAFAVITAMFFALYKFLPNRRIRWQTALLAAGFTSTMFSAARYIFQRYVEQFNPGSLYTGTLYAIVIIVFWVYYAAMIFILGGEVGQVYELRRVRRMQREAFEEHG
jgi:membrane protein